MRRWLTQWSSLLMILLLTVIGAEAGKVPLEVANYLTYINSEHPPPDFVAGAQHGEAPKRKRIVFVDAPGVLDQSDTEYRLTRDVTADGTAFRIKASRVTLNLDGHRVVYNTKEPGNGIFIEKWWAEDVAILNGFLSQGAAQSSGGYHANETSPIRTVHCRRLTVAGLTVRYAGADVIGIYVDGCSGAAIHHNTFIDEGVTVKNRHQGVEVIHLAGDGAKIHNNLISRARQIGIRAGAQADVFWNEVHVDSCTTNSTGITAISGSIHHNRVYGQGVHPIGIWPGRDMRVFDNFVSVQSTSPGGEYGSTGAACIRLMWGSNTNVDVYGNTLILAAEENYRQTGFNSWGRCVWVGVLSPKQQVTFRDNRIIAYSTDGKAKAAAVAVCANAKNTVRNNLLFRNNEIASTWSNLLLADSYGSAGGYSQFVGNRFVRLGAAAGYRTFRSQYSSIPSTAVLLDTSFENGAAADSVDLEFFGPATKELAFGSLLRVQVTRGGVPLANALVSLVDAAGRTMAQGATDGQGSVSVEFVDMVVSNGVSPVFAPASVAGPYKNGKRIELGPHRLIVAVEGVQVERKVVPGEAGPVVVDLSAKVSSP